MILPEQPEYNPGPCSLNQISHYGTCTQRKRERETVYMSIREPYMIIMTIRGPHTGSIIVSMYEGRILIRTQHAPKSRNSFIDHWGALQPHKPLGFPGGMQTPGHSRAKHSRFPNPPASPGAAAPATRDLLAALAQEELPVCRKSEEIRAR